jgi:hypothetical protein
MDVPERERLPLRDEHGYLDWGVLRGLPGHEESHQNTLIHLYVPGASKGVPLPIGRHEVWNTDISYVTFRKAYFFPSVSYFDKDKGPVHGAQWPKNQPHPVWFVEPNGKTERIEIPHSPFEGHGNLSFYATRAGILVASHRTGGMGKPGLAGGYLVQGTNVTKTVAGFVTNVLVSPDGCKVALRLDPYDTLKGIDRWERVTVQMIDVCHGGDHANQSSPQ